MPMLPDGTMLPYGPDTRRQLGTPAASTGDPRFMPQSASMPSPMGQVMPRPPGGAPTGPELASVLGEVGNQAAPTPQQGTGNQFFDRIAGAMAQRMQAPQAPTSGSMPMNKPSGASQPSPAMARMPAGRFPMMYRR